MQVYLSRIGIAMSVLFNVILGGHSNQTFSARNWHWKRSNKWHIVPIIDTLWYKEPNHCLVCWTYWIVRKEIK